MSWVIPKLLVLQPNFNKVNNLASQKVILFVTANPAKTARLLLAEEIRDVTERFNLSEQGKHFNIEVVGAARYDDVRVAILKHQPYIVHFSGHGHVDGTLALETKNGQPDFITPETLSELFSLFSSHVKCVILNACYSEIQAKAIAEHIRYVIGMEQEIDDQIAIKFAVGFYDGIAHGRSIEDAYKFGCNATQRTDKNKALVTLYKEERCITSSSQHIFDLEPTHISEKKEVSGQSSSRSTIEPNSTVYEFIIGGSIYEFDEKKLKAICAHLQKISGDVSLTLLGVEEGSIKLILRGSSKGFHHLKSLFKSGELTEILGESVQGINQLNLPYKTLKSTLIDSASEVILEVNSNPNISEEKDSIKLILQGSTEGFQRLESLLNSGEVTEILGEPVQGVTQLEAPYTTINSESIPSLSETAEAILNIIYSISESAKIKEPIVPKNRTTTTLSFKSLGSPEKAAGVNSGKLSSIYNSTATALGFKSLSSLAKAADVNSGTLSAIYMGKRPLNDSVADKLIEAIRYQNGWSYLDTAFRLVEVLNFLQKHLAHFHGTRVRELTSNDVKRWSCSYHERLKQPQSHRPEPLNLENSYLPVKERLQRVLDYLKYWEMKHDYGYLDEVQRAFDKYYSTLIAPSIKQGMQKDDCYELMKQIYDEIKYIAHFCGEFDFVVEMSTWFIKQSKHNGDTHVRVNALATYAWVLSSQNTPTSLEKAQVHVREAWAIANSIAFLEQITPEGMDVLALLTELRLRLTIRLFKDRYSSLRSIDFDNMLTESRKLLKKPESWQELSSRLKMRYELALDYQHAVYLYHLGEYNQSLLIFKAIRERTNIMGWIRVEQAALSWIASILKATENREELAKVLQRINVPYLSHRQAIREDILGWMGGEDAV